VAKEARFLKHIANMALLKIVSLADELGFFECHNVLLFL
jgi:hypothetical protein